ncbi:hypothetical protein C5167_001809 [Papaver somniferum]|uniref:Myb/SANT-like domain-containing protein n=1 Tax=Papaver somniferum TaxID=3469 RepID=A0A4Y7KXI6_PAPSO|nr:uncharacterized protein LOC113313752 [Papaver somniferum]RZC77616.1 hypothetical protein C5167_001809 [Papaver somniferum]
MDSSDSQPEVDNKGKGKELQWTQEMDECMIKTFAEQATLGHGEEKGFNDQAYDAVSKVLSDRLDGDVSKKCINHRLKTLRAEHRMVRTLREQSGFEWDSTKNEIIASDSTWNDYIKAHPESKYCRGRSFKWDSDSLDVIIGNDNSTDGFAIVAYDSSDSEPEVEEGKVKQLRWTQEMDECMIKILIEQEKLGRKGDRGFKDQAYSAVTRGLSDCLRVDVSRSHIDNRLRTFRTEYRMFRTLREQNEFDWDPVKNKLTASDSIWNEYIKAHPKFKYYRGRACKWNYESLSIILGDNPATGSFPLACIDSCDSQPEVDNKKKGRQLRWTQGMDERLIETVVEQVRSGGKGEKGGFNDQVYNAVSKVLAERLDVDVGRKHIDNRLRTLRTEYRLFSTLRGQTGFCWDPVRSMITAPVGVWNEFIKAHPEFKTCRGRSCKWDYEFLAIIFGSDHLVINNQVTDSFSIDGVDADITSTPVEGIGDADELPLIGEDLCLDYINEEADRSSQDLRRKQTPIQQRRFKKPRTSDIVREVMEAVKTQISGLAKSVDGLSFAKKLYSEVMNVEGFSPDFLDRAFEILKRDGHGAEIFLVRNEVYRKRMLEELYQKYADNCGGSSRADQI